MPAEAVFPPFFYAKEPVTNKELHLNEKTRLPKGAIRIESVSLFGAEGKGSNLRPLGKSRKDICNKKRGGKVRYTFCEKIGWAGIVSRWV